MSRKNGVVSVLSRAMLASLVVTLAACSTTSPRPPAQHPVSQQGAPQRAAPAADVVEIAGRYAGVPYRYGGATPRGFDCSGLVQYVFREAGVSVPRTTRDQYRHARRVRLSALRPGDLVFFRTDKKGVSHVGIYVGKGRFIHAPSSGGTVSYAEMKNPYWNRNFVAAGRIL